MPYSNRTDGKYNRKAEYYLMSVKQRNEVEFRDSLKKEKRRHAEDKVDSLIPLGLHNDSEYFDTAELLYLLNCASKDLGKIFIDGIKKTWVKLFTDNLLKILSSSFSVFGRKP